MTYTHKITYTDRNGTHNLEWTVPKGWNEQAIRDAFHVQYRGKTILSIVANSPTGAGLHNDRGNSDG